MRVVDGAVGVGDVLTYDVRVMAGYGWGYSAQATVLAVDGERVRIEYQKRTGGIVRRWVGARFLYRES